MEEKQVGKYYLQLTDEKRPRISIEVQIESGFYFVANGYRYDSPKLAKEHFDELTHERLVRVYLTNRGQTVVFSHGEALSVGVKP
jgi:hypothetical protein